LILEPALGGPDTTTRTKIEWQVRLQKIEDSDNSPSVSGMKFLSESSSSGTLQVRTNQSKIISSTSDDLCMLPPTSGYRSLENHLYRVEVHKLGSKPGDEITFKFSRENGSVVAKIVDIVGTTLYISSIGRDITSDLRGQWVEITDDRYDLWGMPGTLVKIKDDSNIQGQLEFDSSSTKGKQITEENFPKQFNPKIRRWDSKDGDQKVLESKNNDGFLSLENGIEIKFSKKGTYNTGDYWIIPARTGTSDVEWPQNDEGLPTECQAEGIKHHYASLALLEYTKTDGFVSSVDHRNIFPAMSDLTVLSYVSGDGQSAGPRELLPSPLIVGVTKGKDPVEGYTVRFEIKKGQGSLFKESSGQEIPIGNQITQLDIETDLNGLVKCYWQIDHFTDDQQVEASLWDVNGNRIHLPIIFNTEMNKNELPVGLKVHSGLISDAIPNESYKIIGPIYHDIETNALSSAPPMVTLGETTVTPEDGVLRDKVRQMGDLSLLSAFNEQHGFISPDSVESKTLAEHLGLSDILSNDESASEPLYFKPIVIDEKKFYVLVINYRQNTSHIQWSDEQILFTQEKSTVTKKDGFDQVVSAQNDDGSLEVFVIGTDDMLWHVQQTVPNGSWGGWAKFPDLKIKQIAVAQNADGRLEVLEVFAIDENNSVWHSTQKTPNGDWENWSSLNGKSEQIQVGKNTDGSLEVFAIGVDKMLWHVQQTVPNGSWGGWAKFPDLKIKQIAVAKIPRSKN
jgi:acylphosphatase